MEQGAYVLFSCYHNTSICASNSMGVFGQPQKDDTRAAHITSYFLGDCLLGKS